jgi:hypothetical protein
MELSPQWAGVSRVASRTGEQQRLLLRDIARAPQLPGAEVVEFGGYDDLNGMVKAFTGGDDVVPLLRA